VAHEGRRPETENRFRETHRRDDRRNLVPAHDTRALENARDGCGKASPKRRAGSPSVSPTKSLLETAASTGSPIAAISLRRPIDVSEWSVFLSRSNPGSMTMR
jgi:hypothetical protein